MKRTMRFRFFSKGKYYYFSIPYMSISMFNKLQEPIMDNVKIEQCFLESTSIYGETVTREVWK